MGDRFYGGVAALAVFDDGNGPALYAGGSFTSINGVPMNRIAKRVGTSWEPLGDGVGNSSTVTGVEALAVYDDGGGPALYAGGTFFDSGGVPMLYVAKWDGHSWSPLGSGLDSWVSALEVFDDGSGPALYAGGAFSMAGGQPASKVARWDGTHWSALGNGVMGVDLDYHSSVWALAAFDPGPARGGPALFVGGSFSTTPDSGDSFLARWQGYPDRTPPAISSPDSVSVRDAGAPGEYVTFVVTAADERDSSPSLTCVPPSGSFFPQGTTTVRCEAVDAAGNRSQRSFPVVVRPKATQR